MKSLPRGITLIELLIAISIIVVLTALLIPGLRFISDSNRVHQASQLISSTMHKVANRSKTGHERTSTETDEQGTHTTYFNQKGACLVFYRNPNFQQDGIFFGCNRIKTGKYEATKGREEINNEISYAPKSMWPEFTPPIREQPPGTEVSYNDQETAIEAYVRST